MARGCRTDLLKAREGIRHDLFDSWSDTSAYALGLLFTDGGVTRNGSSWSVSFYNTDLEVVQWLHSIFGSNRKIFVDTRRRKKPLFVAGVTSTPMAERLVSLGVVPGKSKKACRLPLVPDTCRLAFVQGLLDGDGSVQLRKNRKCCGGVNLSVTFVAARTTVAEDFACLLRGLGVPSRVSPRNPKTKVAEVRITGANAESLLLLLSTRQGMAMRRKRAVWNRYLSMRQEHGGIILEMKMEKAA